VDHDWSFPAIEVLLAVLISIDSLTFDIEVVLNSSTSISAGET
jgi:hypothetical protein